HALSTSHICYRERILSANSLSRRCVTEPPSGRARTAAVIRRGRDAPSRNPLVAIVYFLHMAFWRGAFAEGPKAPCRLAVGSRRWNNQLDLCTTIHFAPDRQLATHKLGSFDHAVQTVMPLAPVGAKNLITNALSIVPYAEPEVAFVITDFDLYILRCGVPECIAQRLRRQSVNFVSHDRVQIPGCAFHNYFEVGGGLIRFTSSQHLPNRPNGYGKLILLHR